ncbi:MAG TPA: hypothetical protein VFU13_02255 [Steroidobacteraceae bacterium]|nr:hypothetical protein [Steroidobacteraceae bacterium]
MRFTSGNSRNQLRERQRRDRATAQLMRNMYPQFASLRLEFDFSESDPDITAPARHLLVMHPPSQAYFVFPCPYADCDGEFDLSRAVADLAQSHEPHAHGSQKCGGHRVRDKNGRTPCQLTLEYTIQPAAETAS